MRKGKTMYFYLHCLVRNMKIILRFV